MSMSLFLLCSIREQKSLRKRNPNTLNQKLSTLIVISRKANAKKCRPLDRDRLSEELRKCLGRLAFYRVAEHSPLFREHLESLGTLRFKAGCKVGCGLPM